MNKKILAITLLPLIYLILTPAVAHAATITTCTLNRNTYNQGETGYFTVVVYNDESEMIRVIELTATIDYYYDDGNVYIQTFYAPTDDLPVQIEAGQTETFYIPFSLPTNVAPGYTEPLVRAKTEIWNRHTETWGSSDHPTYQPKLYIESPYKHYYEEVQDTNEELEQELREQQALNTTTTNVVYLLALTTLAFAAFTAFLVLLLRRARPTPALQPTQ
jgi:hypothetical protein